MSDDFQRGLQARLAHLIGEASQWSRGSGAHPPGLVRALNEAFEYGCAEIERLQRERDALAAKVASYERMFHSAVAALAEISDALGIPEDVASTANGNAEILHAIAELKARASHARDALREQRRERLRDAPGGDEPDDDGPCPDRRCTGF